MRVTALAWAAVACLGLTALPVNAAIRIDNVVVRPNPAGFAGSTPPMVEVEVTVRRDPLDMNTCEIEIEPGDGGRVPRLSFPVGSERTKSVRYIYPKPGSYRLTARGVRGCSTSRTVNVTVRPAPDDAAAPSTAVPAASAKQPRCPSGWSLVPNSVQGARYVCEANPPSRPLKCEGGTTYFAEGSRIGCR